MRKALATLMCIAILAVSTTAMAGEVYVTQKGKKYHKENCRFIKNRKTVVMQEKEAKEKGLKPCGKCFKPKKKKQKEK